MLTILIFSWQPRLVGHGAEIMILEESDVFFDQRFVDRPMFGVELVEKFHEKPVAAARYICAHGMVLVR
jgi:hypothetical protein